MKKNLIIVAAFGIFSVLGFLSFKIYKVISLPTVKVTRGEIVSSVFASGKSKAEREARLSFSSTGRIVYLPFRKNQEVKKWQAIATIDTSDLQANKEKELEDYLKTRLDFESTKENEDIKNIGGLSEDARRQALRTLTKSQSDLNKATRDFEIANRALQNASLYSPFDGVITLVNGEINEWVSIYSTKPLITIIDPKTVYFEAELEEENIEKIATGQATIVTLDAYPKKQFKATVSEIDRQAIVKDNGDTVLPVKLVFSDNFYPATGLNGDVQFILERKKNVLILPKLAIRNMGDHNIVVVKRGIVLQDVMIETAASDAKNIEIVKGVNESEQVVLPSELE